MKYYKYYVDVITLIFEDGRLQPLFVCWDDGRYKVDRILSVREMYSKAGGCGICYLCSMQGQMRKLFWERNRWFLESEIFVPSHIDPPIEKPKDSLAKKT